MNTYLSKIDKSRQRLNELSRREAFSHCIKHGSVPRVWNEIMDASHTEEKFLWYLTRYHQAVSHKANVGAEEQSTTHYIWRTKCDGRVRSEHAANDGKLFSWNERPVTGHPGEEYNCDVSLSHMSKGQQSMQRIIFHRVLQHLMVAGVIRIS
ncbi:phage minor head protein [Brucella sp. TWI559]